MIKRLAFGLVVCGLIVGAVSAVRPTAASARTQDRALCSMPDKGSYSPGALVKYRDDVYRCLYVYGDKMTPTGVAWVKGVMVENSFIPKEPSEGR